MQLGARSDAAALSSSSPRTCGSRDGGPLIGQLVQCHSLLTSTSATSFLSIAYEVTNKKKVNLNSSILKSPQPSSVHCLSAKAISANSFSVFVGLSVLAVIHTFTHWHSLSCGAFHL